MSQLRDSVPGKIIPFGYSVAHAQDRLATLMEDERAILVDIRYSVKSKSKPLWSGDALQELYKKRYLPIKSLGNKNYFQHGAPIEIADSETGIPRLLDGLNQGYTIVLLCTCSNYKTCHRKVVVDLVKEQLPDCEVVLP
jgi:uncharacterized protein (DUF488 family)